LTNAIVDRKPLTLVKLGGSLAFPRPTKKKGGNPLRHVHRAAAQLFFFSKPKREKPKKEKKQFFLFLFDYNKTNPSLPVFFFD
jgi:hypothetical protein